MLSEANRPNDARPNDARPNDAPAQPKHPCLLSRLLKYSLAPKDKIPATRLETRVLR